MKKSINHLVVLSVFLLAACSTQPNVHETTAVTPVPASILPTRVTAIGYGATSAYENYSTGQKRLMAMRASKLDAYRALVEQVNGIRLTSNSTVSALASQHDSFRVYIDSYLRGARIVSVTPLPDGNYETVLELDLKEQFYQTLNQSRPAVTLTQGGSQPGQIVVPQQVSPTAHFYYAD